MKKIFKFCSLPNSLSANNQIFINSLFLNSLSTKAFIGFIVLFVFYLNNTYAFTFKKDVVLKWSENKTYKINENFSYTTLYFSDCGYNENRFPVYVEKIYTGYYPSDINVKIDNVVYKALSVEELKNIGHLDSLKENFQIHYSVFSERKTPYLIIEILPLRKNTKTGVVEKIISFSLIAEYSEIALKKQTKNYASNSVLSSGNWYKFSTHSDGIYKITYQDLVNLGLSPATIDPRNIRIYGNGGGMLPEAVSDFRYDDLQENAILVVGEDDGKFDTDDYILMYGTSANRVFYNKTNSRMQHQKNIYSDAAYYFLTTDLGPGKRISSQAQSSQPSNNTITVFDDFLYKNDDNLNLMKSGREWYGDVFDQTLSYNYPFTFPNISTDAQSPVHVYIKLASRCINCTAKFQITINGQTDEVSIGSSGDDYAKPAVYTKQFIPTTSAVNINIQYNKPLSSSIGYLDFIEVNARRNLIMNGPQMIFRNNKLAFSGFVNRYELTSSNPNLKIWEITKPIEPKIQEATFDGQQYVFVQNADSIRTYIAFDGTSYNSIAPVGKILNQNLHSLSNFDMIIVSPQSLMQQAYRLANFRQQNDNYTVAVIAPELIYNEFSSGAQDATAIRDFMKMLYDRGSLPGNKMPRYLLLFGDGSYDFKNRIAGNTNLIPTFQSVNSLSGTASFCTDDYFGLLDEGEGSNSMGLLDIGIGRFPVSTLDLAEKMVDKVIRYSSRGNQIPPNTQQCQINNTISNLADWKNVICFIADDQDNALHFMQADNTSMYVDTNYRNFNIDKIYCDAYPQISTPGGQRYPDVTTAINNRVAKGALLINYTGHGGEVGWAHERILEISDILSWKNKYNMPVFVTATCEFGRWDDPGRTSAGEYVFLNPDGGGASLFTTTRLVFASANDRLNKAFYKYVFVPIDNVNPGLGDVIRQAKNFSNSYPNDRNFSLLGDPGMKLMLPYDSIHTTSLTSSDNKNISDTIKAFEKVTVSGSILNRDGTVNTSFNGIIYPTVFDKPQSFQTLGNDAVTDIRTFTLQKNIIYKGKASVNNGQFQFSFIVPKDISYSYGKGKISYYAENGIIDAAGYYDDFIIGGSSSNFVNDVKGPEVKLYMNDDKFVFGGVTNENPILIAKVFDENGINTVGSGIGHDIVAILDDKINNPIILNEYYESDLNSYQSGVVRYQLKGLTPGKHFLRFKIWDTYNNSTETFIEFIVSETKDLTIDHVLNYPNPFSTSTGFYVNHNQPCCFLDIQIKIYTLTGKLVKTIVQTAETDGFQIKPIMWDGTDNFGDRLANGVYVYHVIVRAKDGKTAEKIEKLVIIR